MSKYLMQYLVTNTINYCNCFVAFGDDWVETLLNQFQCYLSDMEKIKAKWPLLKSAVHEL